MGQTFSRGRLRPWTAGVLALGAIVGIADRAQTAELTWNWGQSTPVQADLYMLPALIQRMLGEGKVGAIRSWSSASGRQGHILLKSGGDRSHASVAVVRVTANVSGRDHTLVTFHYRKDAKRGWVVATCWQPVVTSLVRLRQPSPLAVS